MVRTARESQTSDVILPPSRDGAIIAEGHNQVTATTDPIAHVEVTEIRHACRVLGKGEADGVALAQAIAEASRAEKLVGAVT